MMRWTGQPGDWSAWAWALWLLAAWLWPCALACAQPSLSEEAGRRRLVHLFDFEEQDDGNYESMPMHWYAIGRPPGTSDPNFLRLPLHEQMTERAGFPGYTHVRFDKTHATSGEHSFHLGLNTGAAGAYLQVGTLAAVPRSDYLVSASVRTGGLEHALAQVRAYLIDAEGRRIESSVASSGPLRSDDGWRRVHLHLVGRHPRAAWIGIEIELMQDEREASLLGEHQIGYQDVRGKAWFDDIAVHQLPHVRLRTQSRVNIVRRPSQPKLTVDVRDLTGQPLEARLRVYDLERNLVADASRPFGEGLPSQWEWQPPLERPGWYRMELAVRDGNLGQGARPLIRSRSALLWLAQEPAAMHRGLAAFGVDAQGADAAQLALLPELMRQTGLGAVVLSAWEPNVKLATVSRRVAQLEEVTHALPPSVQGLSMSLAPLPTELAEQLDAEPTDPIPPLAEHVSDWRPYLDPIFMQLGQRVGRWQLGQAQHPQTAGQAGLADQVHQIAQTFRAMTPAPSLVAPWHPWEPPPTGFDSATRFLLSLPASVRPAHTVSHLQPWTAGSSPVTVMLEQPPATRLDQSRRVTSLVMRMLRAWEAGPVDMQLAHPWTHSPQEPIELLPDPLLGAFATTAHRLAGREVVGHLRPDHGIEAMIFDGPAGGMLAVWNESAPAGEKTVRSYLGQAPHSVDVWGHRQALATDGGRHVFKATRTPQFIEGIDAQLALLRASFKLDDPFIDATQAPQKRTLYVTNPWPRTISGRLRLRAPDNWRVTPITHHFHIAPGQTTELPLRFAVPVADTAGHKRLVGEFVFTDREQQSIDAMLPMELGLRTVQFDANIALERNAETGELDAVVTQLVTNRGDEMLALYCFAAMRGHPRQERLIAQLPPGQAVVRRFRFPGAGEAGSAEVVRVGVRESDGPAMLSQMLKLAPQ